MTGPHRKRFLIQGSNGLVVAVLLPRAVQTPFAPASASAPYTARVYGTPILAWGMTCEVGRHAPG